MTLIKVLAAAACVAAGAATAQAGIADWGLVTDPAVLSRSASLTVILANQPAPPAASFKSLGQVYASYCTFTDDAAAGQAAALAQLKARAALKGADGIVGVRYELINKNPRSSCWHRGFTASGLAVVFD